MPQRSRLASRLEPPSGGSLERGSIVEAAAPPTPRERTPASIWDLGESQVGEPAPVYMVLFRLTNRGRRVMRRLPQRILEVNHEAEQRGCEIISQFALLGAYDFVTFVRAKDNATVHHLLAGITSHGDLQTLALPALPAEDFIEAMKRGWQPPSQFR